MFILENEWLVFVLPVVFVAAVVVVFVAAAATVTATAVTVYMKKSR